MRILIAHNRYQQPGGEDNVVATERELLREGGHYVEMLEVDNDRILGTMSQVRASLASIYSPHSKRLMTKAIERVRPDVVHVHNFFPVLSPSVFHACSEAGIPAVHTLHNYRILCAAATLFRDGKVCEECVVSRSMLPGVLHACYRSSRLGSAVTGAGMALNDGFGTWNGTVTAYIALTEFAANKLGSLRIPRDRIFVKPNSTADRGPGSGDGGYALFVGRLTPEKGIRTVLEADAAGRLPMDVVVAGEGPLRQEVEATALRPGSRLIVKGFLQKAEIVSLMKRASVLIFPSIWYEGLPLVLIEAFSLGLPVIAADLENVASLVEHGRSGLLYEAGKPEALAAALTQFVEHPAAAKEMRGAARGEYLSKYTPQANYHTLLSIYEWAAGRPAAETGA